MTSKRLIRQISCALVAGALAAAGPAIAHDARPLSVDISEQSHGVYLVRVRVPPTVEPDNQPVPLWPASCRVQPAGEGRESRPPVQRMLVRCPAGLPGERIGIRYPIYNPSLATLFRLSSAEGEVTARVLPPEERDWRVPKAPGWREVASGYVVLGVQHIWMGVDHLLFVAGLLLLAGTLSRVLLAVTGFTLAHSITLSLSALEVVRVPVAPVESAIALSVLFLAREIARPDPESLARRWPILVSSCFGLLHGFGFAAALREVGLPREETVLGLFCFNIGVELGQIAFILGAVATALAVRAAGRTAGIAESVLQRRPHVLAGYALGIPAAFWFVQRLAAF